MTPLDQCDANRGRWVRVRPPRRALAAQWESTLVDGGGLERDVDVVEVKVVVSPINVKFEVHHILNQLDFVQAWRQARVNENVNAVVVVDVHLVLKNSNFILIEVSRLAPGPKIHVEG